MHGLTAPTIEFSDERLENGLRLIVSEDHLAPLAAVNLWYRVGSRNEPAGRTGFAHLFEHLMFEGSANVAKGEHFAIVERSGGSLNASTSFDRTNYYETVPRHNAETALWLEADRMGTLLEAVDQTNLDNQRAVVKNERRQRYDNQPAGDAMEQVLARLFPQGHPYHHSVIGSMADLDAATLDDVHDFFRRHYAPNNCVLSVVGDVDRRRVREWAERHFGWIGPNPDIPPPHDRTLPLDLGGPIRDVIIDHRLPTPRVHLAYRTPADGTPEHDALMAGCVVAGVGKGSRLHRRLVVDGQLASSVDLHPLRLVGGVSALFVEGVPLAETSTAKLETAIHDTLVSLAEEPVSEAELTRAHGQLRSQVSRRYDGLAGRADALSEAAICFDAPARINHRLPELLAVTPERISEVARAVFRPENQIVVTYLCEGTED